MAKLTIAELKKIKEGASKKMSLRNEEGNVRIVIHMGTCGIAAGGREVMATAVAELAETDREDIKIVAGGCMGMCSSEPNVTVELKDEEPIFYQQIDNNKMRQIFRRHVLQGEVQTDFALARG